jgi:hypothetical protein
MFNSLWKIAFSQGTRALLRGTRRLGENKEHFFTLGAPKNRWIFIVTYFFLP